MAVLVIFLFATTALAFDPLQFKRFLLPSLNSQTSNGTTLPSLTFPFINGTILPNSSVGNWTNTPVAPGGPVVPVAPVAPVVPSVKGQQKCHWGSQTFEHGSRVDQNTFWYLCDNSDFIPMGCFSDTEKRLAFGESYVTQTGYEMMCSKQENGTYRVYPLNCVHGGKKYKPGDTMQDDYYWYTCVLRGEAISKDVSGCVDIKGERIKPGGMMQQGSYVYQCQVGLNGGMVYMPMACSHQGQKYDVSQTMIDGMFWYTCVKQGEEMIMFELTGCMNGEKQLKIGDKYTKDGFVYECQRDGANSLTHAVVGCVEMDPQGNPIKEHPYGERWPTGAEPFMYMVECMKENGKTTQMLTHCVYHASGEDEQAILPGCFRQVNSKLIVMCMKRPDGGLSIDKTPTTEPLKALTAGLKRC